jgi:cyclophilin family peptidyl-prolyl cis-trans isomerase
VTARCVVRWTAAIAVCLGAIAVPVGGGAVGAAPRLGPDRVVLETTAGDVVLGFYPDAAPQTVANILGVARSGALDGVDFFRVVAGYLVQLAPTERTTPLTSAQQAAISRTVPLEVTSGLLHHRGVLSMAHYDGKPDSGGSSFSILLGDAPSLDGKYTVFGDVEQGMDVVDEIAAVPVSGSRPIVPIVVTHALVTDVAGLSATHLRGPVPIGGTGAVGDISTWPRLLVSTPMGDVLAILSPRDAPQHVKLLESLVAAGAYNGAYLGRAAPGSYVQWFPTGSANAASTLPVEPGTVGNVAGAVTIDSRDAERSPALTFLLADNHGLDGRYTAVGWVIQGSDVLDALARVPTGSDRRPRRTMLVTKATILSGGSGVVVIRGLSSGGSNSTTPWGAFGFLAAATVLGGLIFVFSKRLTPALTASAGLLVVLLGFFGLWVGLVPRAGGTSQWLGLALFAGAIALFRLMGRFERGRPVGPPPTGPESPSPEPEPAVSVPR